MKISIFDILYNEFENQYEIIDDKTIVIKNSVGFPLVTEAQRLADIIQRRYGREDVFKSIGDVFNQKCTFRFNINIEDECIEID